MSFYMPNQSPLCYHQIARSMTRAIHAQGVRSNQAVVSCGSCDESSGLQTRQPTYPDGRACFQKATTTLQIQSAHYQHTIKKPTTDERVLILVLDVQGEEKLHII